MIRKQPQHQHHITNLSANTAYSFDFPSPKCKPIMIDQVPQSLANTSQNRVGFLREVVGETDVLWHGDVIEHRIANEWGSLFSCVGMQLRTHVLTTEAKLIKTKTLWISETEKNPSLITIINRVHPSHYNQFSLDLVSMIYLDNYKQLEFF